MYTPLFEKINKLWHLITLPKLDFILKTNSLKSWKFTNISTTRDILLNSYIGGDKSLFKLELDKSKIEKDFKTKPFVYESNNGLQFTEEQEELILTDLIPNINKYVTRFIIIQLAIEDHKKYNWFTTKGGNVNGKHMTMPDIFKTYIPKIIELFGPIYLQKGSVIKKDNGYVNSIINYPIVKKYIGYSSYNQVSKSVMKPVGPKNKIISVIEEHYIPTDNRNKSLSDIVVGYEYNNLFLYKKIENIPNKGNMIFEFNWIDNSYMKETDNLYFIKEAKLVQII